MSGPAWITSRRSQAEWSQSFSASVANITGW